MTASSGRATPSPGHLCAFAAAKAHAGLPPSTRFSTRPRARVPAPAPGPPLLRSGLKRLLPHRGGCLRTSGRPGGFLCSRYRAFLKKTARGPPTPRCEAGGEGYPPGWHRGRAGAGAIWGSRQAQCRQPSSCEGAAWKPTGRATRVSSPRPGRHRVARLPPGRLGPGPGRGLARPGPRGARTRHYLASVVFPEPGRPRRR